MSDIHPRLRPACSLFHLPQAWPGAQGAYLYE